MSTAGGLQELLHRANVELGSAIRTGEPGANAGNCTVTVLKLACSREAGRKTTSKHITLVDDKQSGTGTQKLF